MARLDSLGILENSAKQDPKVRVSGNFSSRRTSAPLLSTVNNWDQSPFCSSGLPGETFGYPGAPGAKGQPGDTGFPGKICFVTMRPESCNIEVRYSPGYPTLADHTTVSKVLSFLDE